MTKKAFIIIAVTAIIIGVIYLYPHIPTHTQNTVPQTAPTSTATTKASPTPTYPIAWQEGNFSYAVTTSTEMGFESCERDPGVTGSGICPGPVDIYLQLQITNNDTIAHSAKSIPIHLGEIDAKGDVSDPQGIVFANSSSTMVGPGQTIDATVTFTTSNANGFVFTTGGASNISFSITNGGMNIQKTDCTFPTTSTVCLSEIQ
jgi:hypothetical protein